MNTLSKTEAKKRLTSIECEVKELRKIIEAPDVKSIVPAIDRIKSFSDACRELKIKTHKDAYRSLRLKRSLGGNVPISKCDDVALKLMIVIRALNEGWWPNWNDSNQRKWYNWFWINKNGSGFVFSYAVDVTTSSILGSRLCFFDEQLAISAASKKWILDLYEEYFT